WRGGVGVGAGRRRPTLVRTWDSTGRPCAARIRYRGNRRIEPVRHVRFPGHPLPALLSLPRAGFASADGRGSGAEAVICVFRFTIVQRSHRAEVTMSTRQNDLAPRSRLRRPAAIVLILFIMVSGYFWGRWFNTHDIAQRDSAILQLQSDAQRLAADIADQNANLTALRAELTSTKATPDAIMPSQNTYNIIPNQSLIAGDGRLTIGMVGPPGNDGINLNVNGKQQKAAAGDVIH